MIKRGRRWEARGGCGGRVNVEVTGLNVQVVVQWEVREVRGV